MKIVLTDSRKVSQFACILRHLKDMSSDIMISIDENRLYTQGMDSSHAALFELNLSKDWFGEFEAEDTPIRLGINCELIFKIFNCLGENQNIKITYNPEENDYIYITLYPLEGENGIRKEFQVPLMNLDCEFLPVPDSDWSADIQMVSDDLSKLIEQLSIFGSDLIVKCDEESIKLLSDGEMGKMKAVIKEEDILTYAIEEDVEVKVKFAISYFSLFTSVSKVNKKVNIHIDVKLPIKIQYDMDDIMDYNDDDEDDEAVNYIRFYLAPKITDF